MKSKFWPEKDPKFAFFYEVEDDLRLNWRAVRVLSWDRDGNPSETIEVYEASAGYAHGCLKWDGCVDMEIGDQDDCMLHFCGPDDGQTLGQLMHGVYALGPEMPSWDWADKGARRT